MKKKKKDQDHCTAMMIGVDKHRFVNVVVPLCPPRTPHYKLTDTRWVYLRD